MLFKNLKAIINEADETTAPTPAEGAAPTDGTVPTNQTPIKKSKADKVADSHADGIGGEIYTIITELSSKIETQLKLAFAKDIESFDVGNNIITVKLKPNNTADANGIINVINMVFAPNIDPLLLKRFELLPQPITNDILMITVEEKTV